MKSRNKVLNILSYAVIIVTLLLLCVAIYWLIRPYKVIDLTHFTVTPARAKIGDEIIMHFHVHKYSHATAESNISLQDGTFYSLASNIVSSPPSEFDTAKPVLIDKAVPPGHYHVVIVARYKVNPLRTITRTFRCENKIEIAKGSDL